MADHRARGGAGHRRSGAGESAPTDDLVDLAALRADDALLDAAHRGDTSAADTSVADTSAADTARATTAPTDTAPPVDAERDEHLTALLAAWRAEVDAEPVPPLVSLDEALAAIAEGEDRGASRASGPPRGPRRRWSWSLAVAAAGLVAVFGFGTAVHQATPGEPLWGITQVVFSSQAASAQRQYDARSTLDRADDAIARGDVDEARTLLRSADERIDAVESDDRTALREQRDRVLAAMPSSPTSSPPGSSTSSAPVATPSTGAPSSTAPSGTPTPGGPSTSVTSPTATTTTTPAGAPGRAGPRGSAGAAG